ncbi:MAG: M3 family oligoendopeptidase [Planctomycetota bacterium]|jgi:pepF/M3 family oligoendopeptidase
MADTFPLTWELESLYPNPESPEFRTLIDELKATLQSLADRSELPAIVDAVDVAKTWADFLADYAAAQAEYGSLNSFVGCHAAADAANRTHQRFEGELSSFGPLLTQIQSNVEFALQAATDELLETFTNHDERLGENRFFLTTSRQTAALRLPKDQELLAADLAVDGLHAWSRLYDRLSGELRVQVMERGQLIDKSPGQISLESPERSVRENNFFAANNAWSSIADTCADALNHIAGSRLSKYRRLNVDHLAAPLNLNRMTRDTLDRMWKTIGERKSCLVDYLRKKAELIGVEQLAWWDLQAPLPSASGTGDGKLTYDAACTKTIDAFTEFSPKLGDFARMAIENRWIEVEDRPGKRQGGFCTDMTTRGQSRIFMTFTGTVDGMSTLAHELGHAYHSYLLRDRPLLLRDYPMNLAETASTFAEAVLGEQQLAATDCRTEKLRLLDQMIGDAVAFLMNIHARFLFDNALHLERTSGELSVERLNELMVESQQRAYLDALSDDGWNPQFWVSKLHFYIADWPFYNFPYTFGYLLSLGTYSLAKEVSGFPTRLDEFLVATGCQPTEAAVQNSFGFDLREAEFWNRSLDIVESRVSQFLKLADG